MFFLINKEDISILLYLSIRMALIDIKKEDVNFQKFSKECFELIVFKKSILLKCVPNLKKKIV